MEIPGRLLEEIYRQAERSYPEECCGVVVASLKNPQELLEVWPCRNAQNEAHKQDIKSFPRTAREAYWIDPRELLAVHKRLREEEKVLRVIYHSHPDHSPNFSTEDAFQAQVEGEPLYPGTEYLVVSVRAGKAGETKRYRWGPQQKDFIS